MENITLLSESSKNLVCDYVEKEVEMNFFDNYLDKEGKILQAGCQRINHCSCNCNHCMVMSG